MVIIRTDIDWKRAAGEPAVARTLPDAYLTLVCEAPEDTEISLW